jgi:uncharacterized FlaG/YvyC family protein
MEVTRAPNGHGIAEKTAEELFSSGKVLEAVSERRIADRKTSQMTEEGLQDAVKQANSLAQSFDRSLKFEYRKEADIYQVSVIDTSKDEVVRKIPPDEVVRFIESIKELFGALIDVKA